MVVTKIISESLIIVGQELWSNKLRSFLSLLGVTIGIFCIISVLSAVDSLEKNLHEGVDKLGSNMLYIQKWPWSFGGEEYPWWEYIKRPSPDYREFKLLDEKLTKAEAVVIFHFAGAKNAKFQGEVVENAEVMAVSQDYHLVYDIQFLDGRFFSTMESHSGSEVTVLGHNVAEALFKNPARAVGKTIKVMGMRCKVIGVAKKEGQSLIDVSLDNNILLPYQLIRRTIDMNSPFVDPTLMVKAKEGVSYAELKEEIIPVLRSSRKLSPREENDFALNEVTLISQALDNTFKAFNLIGFLIGGFAVLVGGFGIANIMFVSVKERTGQIGIKKALGAKNYFVLLEFLLESVILALFGCLIGLLLVFIVMFIARNSIDFEFVLSMNNVLIGFGISGVIGLIFGLFPALVASRMDPVEAMRAK